MRKILSSETGQEHDGEPDHQVVGEGLTASSVLHRHRMLVFVGHVNPAERAGSLAGQQPAVDAVPVENMPARQPPGGLADAELRQADAALVLGTTGAPVLVAGRCCVGSCLDAQHLGDVGNEVAHGCYSVVRAGAEYIRIYI